MSRKNEVTTTLEKLQETADSYFRTYYEFIQCSVLVTSQMIALSKCLKVDYSRRDIVQKANFCVEYDRRLQEVNSVCFK